eukprot:GEMP01058915.1.p1 GENE.GEMP01058915.1~~GEMP01058915.1.p1  ORF type:complete len:276 (+),score=60.85 GEMP01058915.1:28-855(+)
MDTRDKSAPYPKISHQYGQAVAWRRDYSIKIREQAWKTQQDEMFAEKRTAWEVERIEKETRLAEASERRKREIAAEQIRQKRAAVDQAYTNRCRELAIKSRERRRAAAQTRAILEKIDDFRSAQNECDANRRLAKLRAIAGQRDALVERQRQKQSDQELQANREKNIQERELARNQAERVRFEALQADRARKEKLIANYAPSRSVFRASRTCMVNYRHTTTADCGSLCKACGARQDGDCTDGDNENERINAPVELSGNGSDHLTLSQGYAADRSS